MSRGFIFRCVRVGVLGDGGVVVGVLLLLFRVVVDFKGFLERVCRMEF